MRVLPQVWIPVFLISILIAGCGGRPINSLLPVTETVPGTSSVRMLVVTTRAAISSRPGEFFSGERGNEPAFADITVSIPPDANRRVGEIQWPSSVPGNPARNFVVTNVELENKAGALRTFKQITPKARPRRALVFVHGFNNRFDAAVFSLAQIVHDSKADVAPVLFTWPSRGRLLAYNYDRESAAFSRDALEEVLWALAKDPNIDEISILAHSMGTWLTMETLRQMSIRKGRLPAKLQNVVLAAPDIDFDVFLTQVRDIGKPRPEFIVFVSQDDKALAISSVLGGSISRLGAINPETDPYRKMLEAENINVIDLTKLSSGDPFNHNKFAESPEVVRAIGTRLAAGDSVTSNNASIGERIGLITTGAASAVGQTTGLLISAPISVVDGNTRASLGSQAQAVGESVGQTIEATTDTVTTVPASAAGR